MLTKRSFSLAGHRTSVALEEAFWQELRAVAARRGVALAALVMQIDGTRAAGTSLASALRVLSLEEARKNTAHENSSRHRAND